MDTPELAIRVLRHQPVWAITAPNPGLKTLAGTHTYVVGRSPAYVIDPGPDLPVHATRLSRLISVESVRIAGILLTHAHPDHAPLAIPLSQELGAPVYMSRVSPAKPWPSISNSIPLHDGDVLPIGDDGLHVLETPGHSPDHLGFWLPAARALFTGDTVLGEGTTLVQPPEGDMIHYFDTLNRLRGLNALLLFPGHGPVVTDPHRVLTHYLDHRAKRERQVLHALKQGPATPEDLAGPLYGHLNASVLPLAIGSLEGTLAKLVTEGKVRRDDHLFVLNTYEGITIPEPALALKTIRAADKGDD